MILFSSTPFANIQLINMIVSTLSYSNTVANPALYMLLTYNFKEYLQKTFLAKYFKTNKNSNVCESSTFDERKSTVTNLANNCSASKLKRKT